MFKKSSESGQLNIFTSSKSLFSGNSLKMYEDKQAWHNQFRKQITMRIDENIFRPLYCKDNGTPNAPIRILVAMMVLKEAEGLSDQKLFENCRFNMLVRSSLGLNNADDPLPTESTYYLFRKRIQEYAKDTNENLFETAFSQITKGQCAEFEVSGKRIRMDSKLLGSNIAWLSRYELIHETLRLFYKEVKHDVRLDKVIQSRLDELLKLEGNKIVYICSNEEVKSRLQELGELIYSILPLFLTSTSVYYQTLQRVFNEQYKIDEKKMVVAREKEEISTNSVQSPHDTDCHYRNKNDQKVKGYSINVTESCDENKELNLIGHVDVKKASTSDVTFLQEDIEKAKEVFSDKIEAAHADGAYHSPDNQQYCKENKIALYLHAIQGEKSRYQFNFLTNGRLSITNTITNEVIDPKEVVSKDGSIKWRIKTEKGYRYFTQKEIDVYLIRKQIAETPIETLQFRNNVEATIFQLGYHYSNAKSRYRGVIKHQMWANIRCLWVNFVRILKYTKQLCQRTTSIAQKAIKSKTFAYMTGGSELYFAIKTFLSAILPARLFISENIQFSVN
ncbi:transposase [Alkalitalea saponilacus]|uniref:Transposase domain n=6 Tax=Alkalitalea saponilacus TaxID=889453 RepID=A0A1T5HUD3_9BACT|nr:transposase [Alkalitalea saponilacus]ASB47962.1 transposase [Alkalitalea saponilacus]ASB49286.1 transposase [Alkalitalea saponilacus]ASB49966.1 transposase [Alkalitalea saponilacus]ASB50076.1 transposase [Alkalitalea saponilacus]SKC24284.1 Transposase domain [Alkalitalea saponilacus]